jgi:hypothetical protein
LVGAGFVPFVIPVQKQRTQKKSNVINTLHAIGRRFIQQQPVLISGSAGFVAILLKAPRRIA